jgi:hypothetical protein
MASKAHASRPGTLCCIETSILRCPSAVRCEVEFSPTVLSCNALLVVYSHASVRLAGSQLVTSSTPVCCNRLPARWAAVGGKGGASTGGPAKGQSGPVLALTWRLSDTAGLQAHHFAALDRTLEVGYQSSSAMLIQPPAASKHAIPGQPQYGL